MIERVRIDCVVYDVVVTSGPIVVENKLCKGSIDYDNSLIQILGHEKLSKEQSKVTLLHEIVHGILYERHIDPHESSTETLVDELAKGIYHLINRNPKLIAFLTERGGWNEPL